MSVKVGNLISFSFRIDKVCQGMTFKLTPTKHNYTCILISTAGIDKVLFNRLLWKIPKIEPNLETRALLTKQLKSNEIV